MRKFVGILGVFVLAMSLLLVSAPVFAGSLAQDCDYDTVKWEDNPDSCYLYLNNWGKTPLTAMARLAGLASPTVLHDACTNRNANPGACFGSCTACNTEVGSLGACVDPDNCEIADECPGTGDCTLPSASELSCPADAAYGAAKCCCCWGVSLSFANKGWAGCDISAHPRVSNDHPNHFGNSDRRDSGGGGDWGITGCPHSECASDTWCLPDNLCGSY